MCIRDRGFVKLDRRKGAVVALDVDKMRVLDEMRRDLSVVLDVYKRQTDGKDATPLLLEGATLNKAINTTCLLYTSYYQQWPARVFLK